MDFKKAPLLLLLSIFITTGLQAQTRKHKMPAKQSYVKLKASMVAGSTIFSENCAACHQADGTGIPSMNPPLAKTTFVLGDKAKLIKIILNGFSDDVDINGQRYSNTMADHDFLKDQEIADLLTYIRNSFGNKASAISATQVKAVRAANTK